VVIRWVVVHDPQGAYDPQALLSTHVDHTPRHILTWFVRRWRMEVTFEEARAHLGMETPSQWSDVAIARTTPVLLGLFPLVALVVNHLTKGTRCRFARRLGTRKSCRPLPMRWRSSGVIAIFQRRVNVVML
jgi:hypothetical protein